MPAPGQGFVADAQTVAVGAFGHLPQVGRRAGGVVDRCGLYVGTDQHEVGAEGLHRVELAFRAVEVAGPLRLRHRLEVAERLKDRDAKAEVRAHAPHLGRATVEGKQIVLEHLDGVEAGRRRGFELVRQRARQADGGDRCRQAARRVHGDLRPLSRKDHRPVSTSQPVAGLDVDVYVLVS
jgi:hypothetical protein